MKLTKIASSVVAVLAAVAVGGSWYTGKQVEEKYLHLVEQANHQLKQAGLQYGGKFELKDVQIERHFFSSDAKYRLDVETSDGVKLEFIGNDKLNHGPFPLNRLAKFNFAPVLMSVENHLLAPEQFKAAIGDKLGDGVANMSYSGNVEGEFTLSPIKFSDEKVSLESLPIKLDYSYDKNAKNTNAVVHLEKVQISGPKSESATLEGLEYAYLQADEQGYPHLGLGEVKGKMKSFTYKGDDNETLLFKDIVFDGKTTLNGERVVSTARTELGSSNIAGVDIGKWKVDALVDVDAKIANEIAPELSANDEPDSEKITKLLEDLLAKSPKIHLNNFSLEQGEGKFNLALILNAAQTDPATIKDLNGAIKAFSDSKFTFNINRAYIEDISRRAAIVIDKLSEKQAAEDAKQKTNLAFAMADGSWLVAEGDQLKSELRIDKGKVSLNGRELSEEEIQGALFMLMMGAGSLGH